MQTLFSTRRYAVLWILGSEGLLGSALAKKCLENPLLKWIGTSREVDITNMQQLLQFVKEHPKITHIVNCAAFSEVDEAEKRTEEAYEVNAIGPENIAVIAQKIDARLIHISTDYVFSGKIKRPLSEMDPTDPCSYYGKTKLEGEQRALAKGAAVIRTSWIFGNRGKNFVSKLLKMLQSQREIKLTDDQWGRFTYAPDLAEAILKMLDQEGLYQFANIGVCTRYDFGIAMREEAFLLGFPIMAEAIIPVPSAAFPDFCERPVYSALDTAKIEALFPIRHWRHALRDFLCEQQPVYS